MIPIICTLIAGASLVACVHEVMDKWDDEKRRAHERWEAERDGSEGES